jgi:hypothetical protein
MLIPRLACALTLALLTLSPGVEPSPTASLDLVATLTQAEPVCLAPVRPTDSFLSFSESTPLDDEVEVPDEDEDDEPDDAGQALDPDDADPLAAVVDASNSEPNRSATQPRLFEQASSGWEHPRFLSLCRFRC